MKNAYLQFAQLVTGVLVGIFLIIHLSVQRLDLLLGYIGIKVSDPLTWKSMMDRAHQSSWVGIYICLLTLGLFHGLNGLRNVLSELNIPSSAMRILTGLIIAFGIVFLALGIYAPVVLYSYK
jgi:succinate dehydrogenase hydrophobic anchor subunit